MSDIYTVQRLLKHRYNKKGGLEFHVKWKDWSDKHNTWEPEDNILDTNVLDAYWNQHPKAAEEHEKRQREKRRRSGERPCSSKSLPRKRKADSDDDDEVGSSGSSSDEAALRRKKKKQPKRLAASKRKKFVETTDEEEEDEELDEEEEEEEEIEEESVDDDGVEDKKEEEEEIEQERDDKGVEEMELELTEETVEDDDAPSPEEPMPGSSNSAARTPSPVKSPTTVRSPTVKSPTPLPGPSTVRTPSPMKFPIPRVTSPAKQKTSSPQAPAASRAKKRKLKSPPPQAQEPSPRIQCEAPEESPLVEPRRSPEHFIDEDLDEGLEDEQEMEEQEVSGDESIDDTEDDDHNEFYSEQGSSSNEDDDVVYEADLSNEELLDTSSTSSEDFGDADLDADCYSPNRSLLEVDTRLMTPEVIVEVEEEEKKISVAPEQVDIRDGISAEQARMQAILDGTVDMSEVTEDELRAIEDLTNDDGMDAAIVVDKRQEDKIEEDQTVEQPKQVYFRPPTPKNGIPRGPGFEVRPIDDQQPCCSKSLRYDEDEDLPPTPEEPCIIEDGSLIINEHVVDQEDMAAVHAETFGTTPRPHRFVFEDPGMVAHFVEDSVIVEDTFGLSGEQIDRMTEGPLAQLLAQSSDSSDDEDENNNVSREETEEKELDRDEPGHHDSDDVDSDAEAGDVAIYAEAPPSSPASRASEEYEEEEERMLVDLCEDMVDLGLHRADIEEVLQYIVDEQTDGGNEHNDEAPIPESAPELQIDRTELAASLLKTGLDRKDVTNVMEILDEMVRTGEEFEWDTDEEADSTTSEGVQDAMETESLHVEGKKNGEEEVFRPRASSDPTTSKSAAFQEKKTSDKEVESSIKPEDTESMSEDSDVEIESEILRRRMRRNMNRTKIVEDEIIDQGLTDREVANIFVGGDLPAMRARRRAYRHFVPPIGPGEWFDGFYAKDVQFNGRHVLIADGYEDLVEDEGDVAVLEDLQEVTAICVEAQPNNRAVARAQRVLTQTDPQPTNDRGRLQNITYLTQAQVSEVTFGGETVSICEL